MKMLDIGCGFETFAKSAAETYGAHVTGISVSEQQLKYARKICEGLPVDIQLLDYRDGQEKFDRIASTGMFEHVGKRFYHAFKESATQVLRTTGSSSCTHWVLIPLTTKTHG